MYAIIRTGGKQYKVENGDIVVIAAGIPLDTTGSTNLMRVAVVGKR